MEFSSYKFKEGETIGDFANRFSLEAQTLVAMKAATFINVKNALLNAVRDN